jgi:hypothetical protein
MVRDGCAESPLAHLPPGVMRLADLTSKASILAFDFRKPFILGRRILPCAETGMLSDGLTGEKGIQGRCNGVRVGK